jgi:hypothetical protein
MEKSKVLVYVNPVLFISAVVQAVSGLVLVLNGREFFSVIHRYNAFLLSILIVIHLALNWSWVKAFMLPRRG